MCDESKYYPSKKRIERLKELFCWMEGDMIIAAQRQSGEIAEGKVFMF